VVVEQSLPDHFRAFATTVERDGGTTYPAICRALADDPLVLSLLEGAPLPQRRPLLILAAVHYLLLAGARHPLAAFYDTVASIRGETFDPPERSEVAPVFLDFCRVHRDDLEELIRSRATQTNEVGRCSALLPALCHIAALHGAEAPLSLLDLGTSAGLNLLFDDYGYTFRPAAGGAPLQAGIRASSVQLECTARDDLRHLPALSPPPVAARVGLDLSPIDPHAEDGALWLLACLWPDNLARFERFQAALDNARTTAHPVRLERGDMITDLPRVAGTIPGEGPLVVFHTWVAAYLDEPEQRALASAVQRLGTSRPVHHLYCESPFETRGLPTPPPPVPRDSPDMATAVVHVPAGGGTAVRLADTHPHGSWIRWWPPPGS
jgi:hypothetical protein